MSQQKQIVMGAFAGAHGVKGEVKIRSFASDPAALFDFSKLMDKNGKEYVFKKLRNTKPDVFVVRCDAIPTREDAIALKGEKLYVHRDQLPPPDEDEFYHEDLIGLKCETLDGKPHGKVKSVENYGADDMLEIMNVPNVKGTLLIPFTMANFPEIDFDTGIIKLDPLPDPIVSDQEEHA